MLFYKLFCQVCRYLIIFDTLVTPTYAHQALPLRPGMYERMKQSAVRSQRTTCSPSESCQGRGGVAMSYLERQTSTLVLSRPYTQNRRRGFGARGSKAV